MFQLTLDGNTEAEQDRKFEQQKQQLITLLERHAAVPHPAVYDAKKSSYAALILPTARRMKRDSTFGVKELERHISIVRNDLQSPTPATTE